MSTQNFSYRPSVVAIRKLEVAPEAQIAWTRLTDRIRRQLTKSVKTPQDVKKLDSPNLYSVRADGVSVLFENDMGTGLVLSVVTDREAQALQTA